MGSEEEVVVDFTLNGRPVSVDVRDGETLLDMLRERFGVTSVKDGCAPEGSCGACTVLVDGRPVVSCAQPAGRVDGRDVVTLEGLPEATRDAWATAFTTRGAAQCGFCIPGQLMSAHALLERHPHPTADQINEALAGNLCRCTGYQMVIDAVAAAASARARGEKS